MELQGAWQDTAEVGSGYTDLLLLFADGRWASLPMAGGCRRHTLVVAGTWTHADETLVLTTDARVDVVGGKRQIVDENDASMPAGCHWADEKTVEVREKLPPPQRLRLSECTDAQREQGAGDCLRFADKPRWLIAPPDDIVEELGIAVPAAAK